MCLLGESYLKHKYTGRAQVTHFNVKKGNAVQFFDGLNYKALSTIADV